jgi:tetratricopeptide (TPR) repeat protein
MTVRNFPVFENYQELSKAGTELFNSNDFKGAVAKYKDADMVGRYIFENGWALTELDTILTYYIGAAAMQAEMTDDAVLYFQKLADKEISGDGFDLCYRYLAYHYDKQGDRAKSDKYVSIGRRLYPEDAYYDKLDLDRQRKIGGGPALFSKYEKVIAKEPNDYDFRYDYAAEMFNWLYTDPKATAAEKEKVSKSIFEQLNACLKINPSSTDALILKGKTYFNEAAALQESYNKIKGTVAADQEKKKVIKSNMDSYINESIKSLEESVVLFEKMPADDFKNDRRLKNEFKNTLYLLAEAYKFIGNNEKAKYYEKKEQGIQ